MQRSFEILPHTSDKGISAYGQTLAELFENAAAGMFSLMAEIDKYPPTLSKEFVLDSADLESLFRDWLSELLYTFEVEEILFVGFKVNVITETHLEAVAEGLPFSDEIEWIGPEVKAVTYHDLYVRKTDAGWEAQVIFDV